VIDSGQLPSCEDSLNQHRQRANCRSAIWRPSLEAKPSIPDPEDGHDWEGQKVVDSASIG